MNEFNSQVADQQAKTLNTILREDYGWRDDDFVDGMAPLESHRGTKIWNPKTNSSQLMKLLRTMLGPRHKRAVELSDVINRTKLLKFTPPNLDENLESLDKGATPANMAPFPQNDILHWAGFFMREAIVVPDFDEHDEIERAKLLELQNSIGEGKVNASDVQEFLKSDLFNQWVRFRGYGISGHDFIVRLSNAPFVARIPSIVLYGAEWINITSFNDTQ